MTDAERKLWSVLRGRQMEGLKFRRQHPYENYILDFVCLEEKIVVEVDGGQHQEFIIEDGVRTKMLKRLVFAFFDFGTMRYCKRLKLLQNKYYRQRHVKKAHPHPCPLLEGEGVNAYRI
jgi:very-short-patch-repair endonuclease